MSTDYEEFITFYTNKFLNETSVDGLWPPHGLGQEDFCKRMAECEYNVLHPRDGGEIEVFSYGRHQR